MFILSKEIRDTAFCQKNLWYSQVIFPKHLPPHPRIRYTAISFCDPTISVFDASSHNLQYQTFPFTTPRTKLSFTLSSFRWMLVFYLLIYHNNIVTLQSDLDKTYDIPKRYFRNIFLLVQESITQTFHSATTQFRSMTDPYIIYSNWIPRFPYSYHFLYQTMPYHDTYN